MIRPWFRSRLFWLLIPGVCFLAWAWWDSGCFDSGIRITRGYRQVFIRQRGGELMSFWRWDDDPYSYAIVRNRFSLERAPSPPEVLPELSPAGFHLPESAFYHHYAVSHDPPTGYTHTTRIITVAHWVIVLGYTLVSALAITYRQHRKHRLALPGERSEATPPAT